MSSSQEQARRIVDLAMVFRSLHLPPYVAAEIIDLDRNRRGTGPVPSAFSESSIVQTIEPILQPTMLTEGGGRIRRPLVQLRLKRQWTETKREIKALIQEAKGTDYEYFVLGAVLTGALPLEEQPQTGLDVDLQRLPFAPDDANWSNPQIYIGWGDSNSNLNSDTLFVKIEDYENGGLNTVYKEVTPDEAAEIIMILSQVYEIIDVHANPIDIKID